MKRLNKYLNLKTAKKVFSAFISVMLAITLIIMLFMVITVKASGGEPEVFGYQIKTVLSGSMEPEFYTGSIITVKPGGDMTRFKNGDVITFMEEDKLITHRVIEVVNSGENVMYRTKGDNNDAADRELVLSDNVVAEYTGFTIPYVGYIASFAQSKEGGALMLMLPGLLLIGYAGFSIWQGLTQLERRKENQSKSEEVNEGPA
ncbi:signal peptidase I SipW [Piscibacillus sp. B03]|uniref:signal peptidase I SipW n=1 Tax=Piscibacillus sp. B03 TaxID=3457430 RepID=UPI003FCCF28F